MIILKLLNVNNMADLFVLIMNEGLLPPELLRLKGFDQSSAYHTEDVWEHTLLTMRGLPAVSPSTEGRGEDAALGALLVAALWHDAGKYTTRAYKEGKGYTFHGHEKESERMFLSSVEGMAGLSGEEGQQWISDVAFLIRNHMRIFDIGSMGAKKASDLFWHPLFPSLLLLAIADKRGRVGSEDKLEELLGSVEVVSRRPKWVPGAGVGRMD